ncbi:MAG: hypothetical protein U0Y96_02675 [Candidatus Kapaibacterium sp.]
MARLALFSLSYTPMFVLVILKQVLATRKENDAAMFHHLFANWYSSLFFGGMMLLSIFGFLGTIMFIKNMKSDLHASSTLCTVIDVKDKTSEAIGYIATYVIPFLFVDFNDAFSIVGISILLLVIIAPLYVRSTLLVINPLLNLWGHLNDVTLTDSTVDKDGKPVLKTVILLSPTGYFRKGDNVRITSIQQSNHIYYGEAV